MRYFSLLMGICIISLPTFAQAKTYTDTAKCGVIVIDRNIAPANPPLWVTGTATGKTKALACAAAKKVASSKAPRGTQAKHCDCGK